MSGLRIGGVPIAKLKVAELKAELEARELSKTGKKDELVARLTSYMEVGGRWMVAGGRWHAVRMSRCQGARKSMCMFALVKTFVALAVQTTSVRRGTEYRVVSV